MPPVTMAVKVRNVAEDCVLTITGPQSAVLKMHSHDYFVRIEPGVVEPFKHGLVPIKASIGKGVVEIRSYGRV